MEDLKRTISKNLIKYRKSAKLTQLELAEKLKYSDKNVSKWERGDSVPDVVVLKQIADIYGVTVNDFLIERGEVLVVKNEPVKEKQKFLNKNQFFITLLSVGLVWLVAIIAFGVINIFTELDSYSWWSFIIAVPVSTIVVLVFTSIWCSNLLNSIVVSILIWSIALTLFICIRVPDMWLIFIIAIPLQILDLLWFTFRKVKKINKKELEKEAEGK